MTTMKLNKKLITEGFRLFTNTWKLNNGFLTNQQIKKPQRQLKNILR